MVAEYFLDCGRSRSVRFAGGGTHFGCADGFVSDFVWSIIYFAGQLYNLAYGCGSTDLNSSQGVA